MATTTSVKRGRLRQLYNDLVTGGISYPSSGGVTLLVALNTANSSTATAIAGGSILSTSANGRMVQFASGSTGSTQSDLTELSAELCDRYDSAKAALVTSGISSPTDAQIYAQMMAELFAAWESTPDFANAFTAGR